ncbi:Npun_F0296 family exosortase-dependent surface protein [Nostoc sp. CMAA1605]|uniref:Npun_F0296 family exosortase-dependent surface protein n=1 Tax=Nostoc sp. CMAA1605 TaxID=2055159 RepID=UPI001F17BEAE|nr:PEP-CTERM sorting domain-containing protein [Nostoc sp. CMAA1605]MCF4965963.1 PEP-CTERM sorting domain-containing protein [Nostoc sp. CMAA1605]
MLNKLSIALLGLTAVVMSSNSASAVTLKVNAGPFSTYSDVKTVNFNDGTAKDPNGFVTYSNITDNIVIGSKSSHYASPYNTNSHYLTIAPVGSKVGGVNVAGSTGSVTLDFKEAIDYFGFYAGSIDEYNFIDIYSGGQKLKTFSGSDFPTAIANGSWTSEDANKFINLVGENGETFDRVVMRTNGIAFETDNHSYRLANRSVPEPNAMLGLLAIGAFGATSVVKGLKDKIVKG